MVQNTLQTIAFGVAEVDYHILNCELPNHEGACPSTHSILTEQSWAEMECRIWGEGQLYGDTA